MNLERNSRKYVMSLYRRMFGATGYVSTLYKTYGCSRKAQVLQGKIIIKIYLFENKEVTLLMQLNW